MPWPDVTERSLPDAELLDAEIDAPRKQRDLVLAAVADEIKLDRQIGLDVATIFGHHWVAQRDRPDGPEGGADKTVERRPRAVFVVAAIRWVRDARALNVRLAALSR